MLAGDITPLFMVSPFSTSGIPDFQRTTIQKLRAEAAHILPEAFDLHPNLLHLLETKFRREKPRNRETISTEGLATSQGRSIKSAQRNIQTVEETLVLPALVLQIKKKRISTCFLGTSKSFNFIRGFVTQQHPKPVFSFWQTPYLAVGNTVLQPTKLLSWFCRGKIFSSLKAVRPTFQLGPMG